jgi:uncharacterized protein
VCAAGLSLLALVSLLQGCVQPADTPVAGAANAPTESSPPPAQASPAGSAQATPAQAGADGESLLPKPRGFVNDFANVIDDRTEAALEARLTRLKARAKIELAVVTVETTGGQSVFDYSLALARAWGVGPPAGEEGGGVLLLLSTADRKWHIQVTRSLEADLPDEMVAQIGGLMIPALRDGRYGEAVNACVDGLVQRLAERRGFPTKEDGLILQTLPAEKQKPEQRPNAGDRRKSAPGGKP